MENDPHEINNLAIDPSFKKVLNKFRIDMEEYNKRYKPMSDEYEPIIAESVVILEWVKKNRPEEYKRMLEGYEIGFSKSKEEYYKNN